MNYEQLLYVSELANHKTLQETANLLHISKSGLSQSISQLENELGVKLFTRTHQGTLLTEQGKQVLPYIKQMMSANMQLVHQASRLGDKRYVHTTKLAYANTFLRPMLTEFLKIYQPSNPLSIKRESSTTIIDQVRSHVLDAGFIAVDAEHKAQLQGLKFECVHRGHISLITSKNNPLCKKNEISVKDLQTQKFALFNDPYNDQLFDHLQFLCGPLQTIIRLDDSWAMYTVINQLNAVCLARDWQSRHSANTELGTLPKINLSNIINDQFELGWVTNPKYELDDFTGTLIKNINRKLGD